MCGRRHISLSQYCESFPPSFLSNSMLLQNHVCCKLLNFLELLVFSCPSFHYTCPRTSFSTQGSYQVWCYYICINATFGNHSFLELYILYCIDFCTTILVPSMFIMNNYLQTKICNHTFCHRGKSFQARVLRRMVEVGCETNSSSACFCATICWWIVTPITFA